MLSLDVMLSAIAKNISGSIPDADENGDYIIELADAMYLGIKALPDGSGYIVWSEVTAAPTTESGDESERRAAEFLRLHFARLRTNHTAVATRGDDGALFLYARIVPVTEREWLDESAKLLNETEVMRRNLRGTDRTQRSGSANLFSGMSGLFAR